MARKNRRIPQRWLEKTAGFSEDLPKPQDFVRLHWNTAGFCEDLPQDGFGKSPQELQDLVKSSTSGLGIKQVDCWLNIAYCSEPSVCWSFLSKSCGLLDLTSCPPVVPFPLLISFLRWHHWKTIRGWQMGYCWEAFHRNHYLWNPPIFWGTLTESKCRCASNPIIRTSFSVAISKHKSLYQETSHGCTRQQSPSVAWIIVCSIAFVSGWSLCRQEMHCANPGEWRIRVMPNLLPIRDIIHPAYLSTI